MFVIMSYGMIVVLQHLHPFIIDCDAHMFAIMSCGTDKVKLDMLTHARPNTSHQATSVACQ